MDREEYSNEIPNFPGDKDNDQQPQNETDYHALREELLALAESGDIKHSVKTIKKANTETLERIKRDYVRKQTEEINELVSNELIRKLSDLLDNVGMIDDPVGMSDELSENKLLKRDLKNIVGTITPYIPLIGLLCGGAIVGKHVISTKAKEVKPSGCEVVVE